MPPTSPVTPGFRCVSVVFARTVVSGEDHGIKPFVLQLHDGQFMTPGVAIKYVNHTCQTETGQELILHLGSCHHGAARVLSITR